MQQNTEPMNSPICIASPKLRVAWSGNRHSPEQLRMDIYGVWTSRGMMKLARRKDNGGLSSSRITRLSTASAATRPRKEVRKPGFATSLSIDCTNSVNSLCPGN
jgi:hypothetical protein